MKFKNLFLLYLLNPLQNAKMSNIIIGITIPIGGYILLTETEKGKEILDKFTNKKLINETNKGNSKKKSTIEIVETFNENKNQEKIEDFIKKNQEENKEEELEKNLFEIDKNQELNSLTNLLIAINKIDPQNQFRKLSESEIKKIGIEDHLVDFYVKNKFNELEDHFNVEINNNSITFFDSNTYLHNLKNKPGSSIYKIKYNFDFNKEKNTLIITNKEETLFKYKEGQILSKEQYRDADTLNFKTRKNTAQAIYNEYDEKVYFSNINFNNKTINYSVGKINSIYNEELIESNDDLLFIINNLNIIKKYEKNGYKLNIIYFNNEDKIDLTIEKLQIEIMKKFFDNLFEERTISTDEYSDLHGIIQQNSPYKDNNILSLIRYYLINANIEKEGVYENSLEMIKNFGKDKHIIELLNSYDYNIQFIGNQLIFNNINKNYKLIYSFNKEEKTQEIKLSAYVYKNQDLIFELNEKKDNLEICQYMESNKTTDLILIDLLKTLNNIKNIDFKYDRNMQEFINKNFKTTNLEDFIKRFQKTEKNS